MIQQYYGLGLTCNVCGEQSSPLKLDRTAYNVAGRETYTSHMNKKAEALAKEEGFVLISKEKNGLPARHICGNCAILFQKRAESVLGSSKSVSKPKASKKV
jgi:hypothetical protein